MSDSSTKNSLITEDENGWTILNGTNCYGNDITKVQGYASIQSCINYCHERVNFSINFFLLTYRK